MTPERLASVFTELAECYQELFEHTGRNQAVVFTGRVTGGTPETAPIQVHLVDIIGNIEVSVLALEAGVREDRSLPPIQRWARGNRDRGGWAPDPRVLDALRWLADMSSVLVEDWGQTCHDVLFGGEQTRGLLPQARALLGKTERPVWFEHPCPHCNAMSLVSRRPSSGIVTCSNPVCRDAEGRPHRWSVDDWSPYAGASA